MRDTPNNDVRRGVDSLLVVEGNVPDIVPNLVLEAQVYIGRRMSQAVIRIQMTTGRTRGGTPVFFGPALRISLKQVKALKAAFRDMAPILVLGQLFARTPVWCFRCV